jgi:outer membrane protein assembly factor BamB
MALRRRLSALFLLVVAASVLSYPSQASAQSDADWPTYHKDLPRTGVAAGPAGSANIELRWQSPTLDGDIYAEPLTVGNSVLVATENDTVYALDPSSGEVQWSTHLGEPVPGNTLPCGNIDPVGITSTPVADAGAGVLYVSAFLQPTHHELFALDLASGAIHFRQPMDPPGASPQTHLQRSALSLSQGIVYIPFGGRFGDCGDYHGWVVAASTSDGSQIAAYQVPTQREGAIWAPSGATIDSAGNLLVATGNGSSSDQFDYGNALIKLSPDLQVLDWFAPSNWAALNDQDLDLGSLGPTLVDGFVFQAGKDGIGYTLAADHLGGIGGQVVSQKVCGGAYGGTAFAAPYLYVPCRDGLAALKMDGDGAFTLAWRGPQTFANPPILAGGSIWAIDRGDGSVYALNASDGSAQYRSAPAPTPPPHFVTPGVASGRVLAAYGRTIAAFGPQ